MENLTVIQNETLKNNSFENMDQLKTNGGNITQKLNEKIKFRTENKIND